MKVNLLFYCFTLSALIFGGCEPIAAQKILAEENFDLKGINSLTVKGEFCNVELQGKNNEPLHFEGYIRGSGNEDRFHIKYRRNGDEVEVWVESSWRNWGRIESLLTFDVPQHVNVYVDNSSGNVTAGNLHAENVTLLTSSGNIRANDISGNLKIKCSSGNIELKGQKGSLEAGTTSGNIKIREINGDSRVVASSGNIELYSMKGDIETHCTSGNIKMNDVSGAINARTSSGNIHGTAILLEDDSRFEATSGNISMELMNNEPELSFDLDSGSGNLNAFESHADDRLLIRNGRILITGITSSGNQRYTGR